MFEFKKFGKSIESTVSEHGPRLIIRTSIPYEASSVRNVPFEASEPEKGEGSQHRKRPRERLSDRTEGVVKSGCVKPHSSSSVTGTRRARARRLRTARPGSFFAPASSADT